MSVIFKLRGAWMNFYKIGILLLLSECIYAGHPPQVLTFNEGEQFDLTLSRLNYSRIYVSEEKIVSFSSPKGAFSIDKSELEDTKNLDGSIYLKPMTQLPLTIFFSTEKNHHFSLTVTADESKGKTIELIAKEVAKKDLLPSFIPSNSLINEILNTMKAGETPQEFSQTSIFSRPFYLKNLKVMLEKKYEGKNLIGYVYRLENIASNQIQLLPNMFANQNAELLSLSEDILQPKQVAYLYGLYSHDH